jgi:hypothetical protein
LEKSPLVAFHFTGFAPVRGHWAQTIRTRDAQVIATVRIIFSTIFGSDFMIRAEVHSDDHHHTASFDAAKWFEQASDDEIRKLAKADWGGDYEVDIVAEYMADHDKHVAFVFDAKGEQGFECHVCEADAARWLHKHKPALFAELWEGEGILAEDTDAVPFYQKLHG